MTKHWKQLEDETWKCLKAAVSVAPVYVHRFYDSRSAGNSLPAQPADFLAIVSGRTFFIEAKFSEKHRSLKGCFSNNVDDQQIASARLAMRAGAAYVLLFAAVTGEVELWPGQHLVDCRLNHKRLDKSKAQLFDSVKEAIAFITGEQS